MAPAMPQTISEPVEEVDHRQITGIVTDRKGEPIAGATVQMKEDTRKIVATGPDGDFTMTDVPDACTLQVSYVGYTPQEVKVLPGTDSYVVRMRVNRTMLDEVVVVGYATQKKVDLTGAVSSVSVDALADRPLTNATNALAGLAAGLTVTNSGGNTPGYESQSILVRGQGTLNNSAPLVVVDGMTGIALSDINPQDIENISVLKDAASAAIYGSRAANGVILVTTRHGAERAPRVTYSGNVSFETVAKRLNLVTDYADFMEIQNAGLVVVR